MKIKIALLISLGVVTAGLLIAAFPLVADSCNKDKPAATCPYECAGLEAVLEHIATARKAVDAGNKDEALAALDKAEAGIKTSCMALRPPVVNAKCPMMGNKIDPARVHAKLYRIHNGRGVGFCCASCPEEWDKLSDTEKTEKLKAAGIKAVAPSGTCPAEGEKPPGCCDGCLN